MLIVTRRKILVTLNVYYWMPDYENILQQFIWQTMDVKPKYPRVPYKIKVKLLVFSRHFYMVYGHSLNTTFLNLVF